MPTAFVTGGSGFVGGRLIERLVRNGWPVRALARSDEAAAKVRTLGAEAARGDLHDRPALARAAQGCDVCFHAAAALGDWGRRRDFVRGNVEGTANVVAACRQAGVRRLVHVGTEAALLKGQSLVGADESYPLAFDSPVHYSATKARAEQIVLSESRDGFEGVVVRPRLVWGPGDATLLPAFVEIVRSGRWRWIRGGRHLTSTTHIDNTVHGLVLAAERGRPGAAYFVTDGPPAVFRDFMTAYVGTQGVTLPDRSVPAPVARVLATVGETAWRLLPLPGRPPLTRFAYWFSSTECTLSDARARRELGYEPVITREDGLAALSTS